MMLKSDLVTYKAEQQKFIKQTGVKVFSSGTFMDWDEEKFGKYWWYADRKSRHIDNCIGKEGFVYKIFSDALGVRILPGGETYYIPFQCVNITNIEPTDRVLFYGIISDIIYRDMQNFDFVPVSEMYERLSQKKDVFDKLLKVCRGFQKGTGAKFDDMVYSTTFSVCVKMIVEEIL